MKGTAGSREIEIRIGTSGWQYDHWKEVFYPDSIDKKAWFGYYADIFDTVEINNTFYNLPSKQTFDSWREKAPPGFRYTLKYSRYGTHLKRLKDPEDHISTFLDRAERLKSFMGPILVQLRPDWKANTRRLKRFLRAAPSRCRWAIELRDSSWLCEETYNILREHNAALVQHDMIDNHPEIATADWVYLRFHGPGEDRYTGRYTDEMLSKIAGRIFGYAADGLDVYVYFNNDQSGYAPDNALALQEQVKNKI